MQDYYVEPKFTFKGIPTSFEVGIQSYDGCVMTTPPHMHDKIEILYCLSGGLKCNIGGSEVDVAVGDMVVINSNIVHRFVGTDEGENRYFVLKITPELLYDSSRAIFEMKYVLPFTLRQSAYPNLFPKSELANSDVPQLFDDMKEEFEKQEFGYELAVRASICRLFLWILRRWHGSGLDLQMRESIPDAHIKLLQKTFDYVDNHYMEEISVNDLAQLCLVSYSHFSRLFKQAMGRSFTEYLNHYRVGKAERLLTSTSKSITEVAYDAGFSDSGYFIKVFKSQKGMSPKKFKKLYEDL